MNTRKKSFASDSSKALTIAAIFVSFCALAVSVYQSIILRNQQYATVWPYIEPNIWYTNHDFELSIQNKGTGPAIIKQVKISLDGKKVTDYQLFMNDLLQVNAFSAISISSVNNSVLSAGEKVQMLKAETPDSVFITKKDFPQRTVLTICYCSIFGDCWRYVDGEVKRVKRCD